MKLILASLMLISSAAFAGQNTIEDRVLVMLIANSGNVQLVDKSSGQPLSDEQQLPQLIADQLSYGYLGSTNNPSSARVLGNVETKCVNVTPKGKLGSADFHCSVTLLNGDFTVNAKKGTMSGPNLESSITIELDASEVVVPNAKPVLKSNILAVQFAG